MCIDLTDIVLDSGRVLNVYYSDFDIIIDKERVLNVYWSDWHSYRQGKSFECVSDWHSCKKGKSFECVLTCDGISSFGGDPVRLT